MPSYASYIVSIHALGTTDDENVPPSMRILYVGRTFCGKFAGRDDAVTTYETRTDVAHCYLIHIMCIHVYIHINRPIYVVHVTGT